MPTRYYALQGIEDTASGLIREVRNEEGLALEYLNGSGVWIWDPTLSKYFFEGELGADLIDEAQALIIAQKITLGKKIEGEKAQARDRQGRFARTGSGGGGAVSATKTRFQKRLGKCYELAGSEALFGDVVKGSTDVKLVHGTIQGKGLPSNPHAWVEMKRRGTDLAWEPISEKIMPRDYYYGAFKAKPRARYSVEEARVNALKSKHWGPWEGSYFTVGKDKKVTPR